MPTLTMTDDPDIPTVMEHASASRIQLASIIIVNVIICQIKRL